MRAVLQALGLPHAGAPVKCDRRRDLCIKHTTLGLVTEETESFVKMFKARTHLSHTFGV